MYLPYPTCEERSETRYSPSSDDFPILLDFGLGQLSTHKGCIALVQTSPASFLQDYSKCKSARGISLFPWFNPNEWCPKTLNWIDDISVMSFIPYHQDHKYSINDDYWKLKKVPEIRFVILLFVELNKIDGSLQVRKKLQKIWKPKNNRP